MIGRRGLIYRNDPITRLDHRGVIQTMIKTVSSVMDSLAQCSQWSGASAFVPAFSRLKRPEGGTRRCSIAMPADRSTPTDAMHWARLIEAVATRQDRVAFAELFEHFAPRVKTFMRRSGASEGSADELAQETLLAVWRKAALFEPLTAGASAWIFTIARNQRIDALRRERCSGFHAASDVEAEFQVDESPQPDSLVAAAQMEDRVRAAIAELSDQQMHVVELAFYEEKAHAEIAQILQIPLGTVKSRLRLAMNRLRSLLGGLS
jgi:RNA polymerase sigma-70 factor, ECF subfamily